MQLPPQPSSFRPIVAGALYPAVERGLAADLGATKLLGGIAYPVCTSLLMAGHGMVTDATDVPEDTIRAQFEHVLATVQPNALKIGVLSSHSAAEVVLQFAGAFAGPTLLDVQLSGPSGETVLTRRGIDVLMAQLSVPDLVVVDRFDAGPLSGGEINSLDDAQVAAQRFIQRGARAVVIKCGTVPRRHYESDDPLPGGESFNTDLYFEGQEFALFEAPHAQGVHEGGASSIFDLATLKGLVDGKSPVESLQEAKRAVTDVLHDNF